MADIVEFAQSFWVVWLLVLFVGIVIWAYRPKRKRDMERYGRIPLDDDTPLDRRHRGDDSDGDGDGGNGGNGS